MSVAYLVHETAPEFGGLPLPISGSWYRLRAHAVGRDLAFDGVTRWVCGERRLIQIWPDTQHRPPVDVWRDDPWRLQGRLSYGHVPSVAEAK